MSDAFALHPRLAADTGFVADWPLCRVLLMNDARFPWLILVPRRDAVVELFDLTASEQQMLVAEASQAAKVLKNWAAADKTNIAALGNVVPQLHVHVIARKHTDAAWPSPVWCAGGAISYPDLNAAAAALRQAL
jgi:diadenosine tetraphosphate (Ap4A) HIT family hydrolase